jgi:hypothetical protein
VPHVIRDRSENGFSTGAGLVAMVVSLLLVAILLLFSTGAFSGTSGSGATTDNTSILSRSPTESQIKLCAEGRSSTYGSPPSSAQQAKCLNELAGEISSTAGSP